MLGLLDAEVAFHLLAEDAAQRRAGAGLGAILADPGLRVLLGLEQRLDDAKVHGLERRVADLLEVHAVAGLALLGFL